MVDFDLKNKKSEPIELENKKPILDKLGLICYWKKKLLFQECG